jgi:hypothetical protein
MSGEDVWRGCLERNGLSFLVDVFVPGVERMILYRRNAGIQPVERSG